MSVSKDALPTRTTLVLESVVPGSLSVPALLNTFQEDRIRFRPLGHRHNNSEQFLCCGSQLVLRAIRELIFSGVPDELSLLHASKRPTQRAILKVAVLFARPRSVVPLQPNGVKEIRVV